MLKVGCLVTLNPKSKYFGWGKNNPSDSKVVGQVVDVEDVILEIRVNWGGYVNSYTEEDLVLCKGKPLEYSLSNRINYAVELLQNLKHDERVARYAVIQSLSQFPIVDGNTACHAGLSRKQYKGSLAVVSCIHQGLAYPWFYRWLIDRSPWKECFIRRSDWSLKNGCVVVTTDAPQNLMRGALFATRIWEYSEQMKALNSIHRSVPLDLAYPILCQLRPGSDPGLAESYGGHFPFNHMPSRDALKGFVNHAPRHLSEPYKEVLCSGGSVNDTFGDGFAPVDRHWLLNELKKAAPCKTLGFGSTVRVPKPLFTKFLRGLYKELKET